MGACQCMGVVWPYFDIFNFFIDALESMVAAVAIASLQCLFVSFIPLLYFDVRYAGLAATQPPM